MSNMGKPELPEAEVRQQRASKIVPPGAKMAGRLTHPVSDAMLPLEESKPRPQGHLQAREDDAGYNRVLPPESMEFCDQSLLHT
jgi:hypothetical protein